MILAIETATPVCSVAILDGDNVIVELTQESYQRHNEILAVMVNQALSDANLRIGDIDRIAVSIGPGSFTGLRVGLSYAKGVSLALDVPIIPISSLDALAHSIAVRSGNIKEGETICPLITARRNEAFGKIVRIEGGRLIEVRPVFCGERDYLLSVIGTECDIVGGGGADLLFNGQKDKFVTEINYVSGLGSSAASVGKLANMTGNNGITAKASRDIEPMYMKEFTVTPRKS